MTELEEFSKLLEEGDGYYQYWQELTYIGCEINGYITVSQEFGEERRWYRNCEVVTKSPTGRLYRWNYDDCYTGDGEDQRLYTDVVEVEKVTRMVEITEYKEIK